MTPLARTVSRHGLEALNFFVSALQTGFGPFVSVWLFNRGWSDTDVGVALSVGTIAALIAQLPGGVLVDAIHRKRNAAAAALAGLACGALAMAATPTTATVWTAEILHGAASAVIGPAIAALTLSLSGHDAFSERLGGNARYASLGSALAAVSFGVVSTYLGDRGIIIL